MIPEAYIHQELFDNFPRVHTAIAEWIACMIFIQPRTKRFSGWKLYAIYLGFAVLLLITNYLNEMAAGWPWIVLMAACMLEMYFMIRVCCRASVRKALHSWAHAFMAAEFAASLEWQINCYIIYDVRWLRYEEFFIAMGITYLVVFSLLWLLNNRIALMKSIPHVSREDAIASVLIALLMFALGNFRFALPNATISKLTGAGILFIRTMTDFSGLLLLYIIDIQRRALQSRYELSAMDNLLNRQYEQFQAAEINNETLRRIYHDLKHQISFIREEKDPEKRESYLERLDNAVSGYEVYANTGNAALDTLLTSKNMICQELRITLTIFADATDMGFLDVMDLCSIFGNAIDNAIEAEQRIADPDSRLIKITVRTQNRFLLIRIENYCTETIRLSNGLIATSKKDENLHGFGIKSIRRAVDKYEGTMTIEQEDEWFILNILLPIPDKVT